MSVNAVLKGLADPTRRQIIHLLRERSRSAGDIASYFDISKPSVSFHLSQLKDAGLIYGERDGTTITYHLNLSVLEDLLAFVADLRRPPPGSAPPSDGTGHDDRMDPSKESIPKKGEGHAGQSGDPEVHAEG